MRDALLGLLILLAVASDKIILGRLRAIWVRGRATREDQAVAAATADGESATGA